MHLRTLRAVLDIHKVMEKLRVKNLRKKADDPYIALLAYRSTPLQNGYSPAELLMGLKLRATVPVVPTILQPRLPKQTQLQNRETNARAKQSNNYNRAHKAQALPDLNVGDSVWINDPLTVGSRDQIISGIILDKSSTPRSYHVEGERGTVRRNRKHLTRIPYDQRGAPPNRIDSPSSVLERPEIDTSPNSHPSHADPKIVVTRSGRVQWEVNHGKCGICGDSWQGPRENEAGGKYANGIITRHFVEGQNINTLVDITANHLGWFEFRICPHNNVKTPARQDCLDKYLLQQADDSGTRHRINSRVGNYSIDLKLPIGLTCSQCILQWKYHAGNSWGVDEHGRGCIGCGAQEEFYGCADIAIEGHDDKTTKPPIVTTPSDPSQHGTSVKPLVCISVGVWVAQPAMTDWCNLNCPLGMCPHGICKCF